MADQQNRESNIFPKETDNRNIRSSEAAHYHRQASFSFCFPAQHKAALDELKVMNIFNMWIFMTKNLKRKKESKGLPAKINPGIKVIHLKTYQVLSYASYYTRTPVRSQLLIVPMKLSYKNKEVLLVAL